MCPAVWPQVADPDENHEPEPDGQAGGAARDPARGHPRGALGNTWTAARAHAQVGQHASWPPGSAFTVCLPVLRIHEILVRTRIRGSISLTNGSCYFRQ
jgi:hypothetical protein